MSVSTFTFHPDMNWYHPYICCLPNRFCLLAKCWKIPYCCSNCTGLGTSRTALYSTSLIFRSWSRLCTPKPCGSTAELCCWISTGLQCPRTLPSPPYPKARTIGKHNQWQQLLLDWGQTVGFWSCGGCWFCPLRTGRVRWVRSPLLINLIDILNPL